jgi:limonene 1,2-monooxygenase
VDRKDWRVLLSWHIAETREQAMREAGEGLMRWNNEYIFDTLKRPGTKRFTSPQEALEAIAFAPGAATVIGTPDDLVAAVRRLIPITGGFGTLIGFVHDWANRENTSRSWDMVARYVVPELNGMLDTYRESKEFVITHRDAFEAAGKAVMNKILEHEGATAALAKTKDSRLAMPGHNAPDLVRKG